MNDTTATFVTGSTLRHVVVMSATSAVGLMALFLVDVVNLFYISMLGSKELTAAVGYATTLQFFTISLSIGLAIAATALVSRAIGAGERATARRLAASSLVTLAVILAVVSLALVVWRGPGLALLGATGETRAVAEDFLAITLPALPLLGIGMVCAGLLRAVGDGRRAMMVTLGAGVVTAVSDPILIFGFGLGVDGAAIASVIARAMVAGIGLWGVLRVHDIVGRVDLRATWRDARGLLLLAAPMVATQFSTPFGNAYLTRMVSHFGDDAVAGWSVAARLMAFGFAGIFALSGAIGPIFGQNLGAQRPDRIRRIYADALLVVTVYVAVVWALLALGTGEVIAVFGLVGDGAEVLRGFTHFGAGAFLFTAALFVANSAFNNLGHPVWSTGFNWSRDALVIPLLAWVIGTSLGPAGVVVMQAVAGLLVGSLAALVGWRFVNRLPPRASSIPAEVITLGDTPLAQAAQSR